MVVVKNTRIAILSANNELITFMDNSHKKSIHYWNDELHEYLQGAAHTYTFTTDAKHPESFNIIEGNKISFILGEKQYYLNIVRVERTERNIMVEAWSLSFELTSEHVGAYKAEKAMSFEEYLRIFDAERTLRVGLNEITDRRITNEWTGDSTILARLFSLASVFDSEIEFQTVLNEDYSLKEIVLNVYRKQSDVDSGIGKFRDDFVLRYGKGISGITKTSDITELYTAIRPYGNDNMTISGMDKKEYDSNGNLLYYIEGDAIVAPQARDRFPSNFVNKAGAYIAVNKEYDTDSKEKLYDMALSDLKKSCVPVVTYDVSGYFETDIGDTVRIADEEFIPVLYLQARVVEQIRSLTNPETGRTVCSNFKELKSEISEDLLQKVEDLINKTKLYTSSISSDNGTIFKNNEGITSLTAYVRDNGVDKTEKFSVRWFKDGMPIYTGRAIKIRAEDVEVKAAYKFEARDKDGILRGFEEVTATNISDGKPGKDGATYYTWIKYADDEYGNGMSDSPNGKYYIGLAFDKESQTESNNPQDYQWSKYRGDNGSDGQDGVGISRITKYYLASDKNTGITASTYGWTTTMQQITPQKRYLWSYESTLYTDQSSTNTTPIIIGVHGEDGDSSGVMESASPPDNPHTGMLWKNTGTSGGRVQGAVYRWNGSMWELFKFTASNIEAETFKGFDFIGANFTSVDEFISPHHIDDNTVVEAKHKVNLKISKGAIVATDDLYFKQGEGWTSSPQEHRLTQLLAGNGIYCYIEDYRTGERKRMSLDADGFDPPQSFFNLVYPVGSIYMSVNPINPSELFPLTAWTEWGKGRVPVGVDTSQTEFNKAEKTGGSKAVILTVDQIPTHTHKVPKPEWYGVKSEADTGFGMLKTKNPIKDGSDGFVSASAGGGKAHSNLQPYITCYMWVRTA